MVARRERARVPRRVAARDVWIVEAATGEARNVTGGGFEPASFARPAFLSNGDLLLCGPTSGPCPYYASNPTVSPDGSTLAFQLSIDGDTEGQGDGILLLGLSGT